MIKKINIAIIGFGNIGSYFYQCLQKSKETIFIKTGRYPVIKYITKLKLNNTSIDTINNVNKYDIILYSLHIKLGH